MSLSKNSRRLCVIVVLLVSACGIGSVSTAPKTTVLSVQCDPETNRAELPDHYRQLHIPYTNLEKLVTTITAALNAGARVSEIDSALHPFNGQAVTFDFENDGVSEIVTLTEIFMSYSQNEHYLSNAVTVYHCEHGVYTATVISDNWFVGGQAFAAVEDFFHDGKAELIIQGTYRGLDGFCAMDVQILGIVAGSFADLALGKDTPDCPGQLELADTNQDGLIDVILRGKTSSTLAAEPAPRDKTVIYIANPDGGFDVLVQVKPTP